MQHDSCVIVPAEITYSSVTDGIRWYFDNDSYHDDVILLQMYKDIDIRSLYRSNEDHSTHRLYSVQCVNIGYIYYV